MSVFTKIFRLLSNLFRKSSRSKQHDYIAGFGSTKAPPHGQLIVSVHPAVAFRPERLIIPSTIASHFQVVDVKVGRKSQLVSIGSLPAVMFAEQAFEVHLLMDLATPSDFITIVVINTSDDVQFFQGGVWGQAE
jgi:hypothetical protein